LFLEKLGGDDGSDQEGWGRDRKMQGQGVRVVHKNGIFIDVRWYEERVKGYDECSETSDDVLTTPESVALGADGTDEFMAQAQAVQLATHTGGVPYEE
jgi:hypothetical protein